MECRPDDSSRASCDDSAADGESAPPASGLPHLVVPSGWRGEPSAEPRYELRARLGAGGSGRVFAAFDRDLAREVALKVVERTSEERLARFILEARVTARLEHPHIVAVYDAGVVGDRMYLAMRLVRGESLGELIRRARRAGATQLMAPNDLINLFLKLCDAVAFAHARGIIHQDIKPDNVMVGAYGEVTLLDWGTATLRAAGAAERRTAEGTPHYMSPAQAAGLPPTVRDDVFALGATLFYALVLRRPLHATASAPEFWPRKLAGELDVPTAEECRHIPRSLLHTALRAMSADPLARHSSAADFAQELSNFQAGLANWTTTTHVDTFDAGYLDRWVVVEGAFERDPVGLVSADAAACRLVWRQRQRGPIALELEAEALAGSALGDLSLFWTDQEVFASEPPRLRVTRPLSCGSEGAVSSRLFAFQVGAYSNLRSGIFREGGFPLVTTSFQIEAERRYLVRVELDWHRLGLYVDGQLLVEYHEAFPLASGHIGVMSHGRGKRFRRFTVQQRGLPTRVSPILLGDEAYQRDRLDDAITRYQRVEQAHAESPLGEESRYMRALCWYRLGRVTTARELWATLNDRHFSTLAALHQLDDEFAADRHEVVVTRLRDLLRGRPRQRLALTSRWAAYVEELQRRFPLAVEPYLELRAAEFPDDSNTHELVADVLCSLARGADVLREYPNLDAAVSRALMIEGRFDECLERFGHLGWIASLCRIMLGRGEEIPADDSHYWLAVIYRGRASEDPPVSTHPEYWLARGEPAHALARSDEAVYQSLALRHLGRDEAAAELEPVWTRFAEWRLEEAEALARQPRDLRWVRYARAYAAWRDGAATTFERYRGLLAATPYSHLWVFVPTLEHIFFPLLQALAGEREAAFEELRRVAHEQAHTFGQMLAYFAGYVVGDLDDERFLAQPTRLGLAARHAVARGVVAEVAGETRAAARWYEEYRALPLHRRGFDWVDPNPVIERFVADRLAGCRLREE